MEWRELSNDDIQRLDAAELLDVIQEMWNEWTSGDVRWGEDARRWRYERLQLDADCAQTSTAHIERACSRAREPTNRSDLARAIGPGA